MADAVVSVFLEKLLTALEEKSSVVSEFSDQFEKLRDELQLMRSFLSDAEILKRRGGNSALRAIMANLRELIYEAEDILADCEVQSTAEPKIFGFPSMFNCISPSELPFRYQAGMRLININQRISEIKQRILSYVGVLLAGRRSPEAAFNSEGRSSSFYDHDQVVVGLEGDTEKIKEWLFNSNQPLLAIGIVGMGGLGKTTAARTVFENRQVEDFYDRRIWVSVSQPLNEERILRSMLRSLGDASSGDDKDELLRKIKQYLQGSKFLLVMDDVWSEDNRWWHRIYSVLPKGNRSSVIITTRNENVAYNMGVMEERIHRPDLLSEGNSWLLLRLIALASENGECRDPELESVGREIVQKCKGFPLAIKAVGGILFYKSPNFFQWKRIAGHFREELAKNGDTVKASLQLSFDELPSHLKACMLCFSLYPEDCVINKNQLVHWWIGEGFVPMKNDELTTDAGEDCFIGLTNRCLVEVVERNYNGKIAACKMHDMVRDLVIGLAEENAFTSSTRANSRHLGLAGNVDPLCSLANIKLRALLSTLDIGEVNEMGYEELTNFRKCRFLRVLDLSKSIFDASLESVFAEIGSLKHLAYLSLSNMHPLVQIPCALGDLKNLRILDVSYCLNLEVLPPCITTLEKLVVLDVSHCGLLKYLPKGLGRLSNLEACIGFRPARSNESRGCRIAELRTLTRLRTLGLRLTESDEIGEDEVNVLLDLHQLHFLTICCYGSHDNHLVTKLNKLSLPQELHELCLRFFPGYSSPTWLNPFSLPMLQYLSMSYGNLVRMHPSFWGNERKLWKIEGLMLNSLLDLETEWPEIQQAMPHLRVMNVSWCPKLDSFPVEDIGFQGGVWKNVEQRR